MKKFLQLTSAQNDTIFIDANSITAVGSDTNNRAQAFVWILGSGQPIVVKNAPVFLMQKLKQLGIAEGVI
ncbi:MAG: hypothetical protein ACJ749_17585 [Flavisolibacter sp.]|jgi:hypothetical protein